ncbi:MAG: inhibitor of apoptosis-promoting Bax1 protein [Sylvanvirus sp.]|uniref:Inhibitor of apoptosis-promoting Bax1 protein n=1 Tax=Sylvanvirus sp. TaxID=2487774 RepID=A0A3G5AID5_9VIRU|nr:MAG: inhibitor of apoptosis-promoting Bax1 protein [Sylvanvirus sp.]
MNRMFPLASRLLYRGESTRTFSTFRVSKNGTFNRNACLQGLYQSCQLQHVRFFSNDLKSKSVFNKKYDPDRSTPSDISVHENIHIVEADVIDDNRSNNNGSTAYEILDEDKGLKRFVRKVVTTTGGALSVTCASAYLLSLLPIDSCSPGLLAGTYIAGFCGSLYSIWKIKQGDYTSVVKKENGYIYHSIVNSRARKNAFAAFVACNALTLTPIFAMIVNPFIIPAALVLTGGTMAFSAKFALTRINGQLLTWQGPLLGGLLGMIGIGLTAIITHGVMGPNVFSEIFFSIEPYIGIALFSAITAYDVHNAIDTYKNKDADHIGITTDIFLDFMNILVRFLHILSKIEKK